MTGLLGSTPARFAFGIAVAASLWGPQQTFRGGVQVVSLTVGVAGDGEKLGVLTATDFEVRDNGVVQVPELMSTATVPLDLTLVLTSAFRTGSTLSDRSRRAINVADQARRVLSNADRLRIVAVNANVAPARELSDPERRLDAVPVEAPGGLALVDGIFYAMALPVAAGRRHVVVTFTDGWDTWSVLETAQLPRLAALSDATLFVATWDSPSVGPSAQGGVYLSGPAHERERLASYRVLSEAASLSGGSVLEVGDATEALAAVARQFRDGYLLSYTPSNAAEPGWHSISVTLRRSPSTPIRTRNGYYNRSGR